MQCLHSLLCLDFVHLHDLIHQYSISWNAKRRNSTTEAYIWIMALFPSTQLYDKIFVNSNL